MNLDEAKVGVGGLMRRSIHFMEGIDGRIDVDIANRPREAAPLILLPLPEGGCPRKGWQDKWNVTG